MSDTPPAVEAPEGGPKPKGIKAALGKKIGPLPAGAWLLAVLGGVMVAVVIRRRALAQGDGPTDAATDDAVGSGWDQPDAGGTNTGVGGSVGNGGGEVRWQDPPAPTTPDATPDAAGNGGPTHRPSSVAQAKNADTNPAWRKHATDALVNRGFERGAVDKALLDYVRGHKLTAQEAKIAAAAVSLVGPPPKGVNKNTEAGDIHRTQQPKPAGGQKPHDSDGDGKNNKRDRDDDNDGWPDKRDRFPKNPRKH